MPEDRLISLQDRLKALSKRAVKSDEEIEAWERQRAKLTGNKLIDESIDQAKEKISKQPHEQIPFSFMPTSMTRTSPFFPMNKRQMKDRPIERGLTWETPWGRIVVSGERLSIYDESILLSLLTLMSKYQTESFQTTQHELCRFSNVKPGKNTYRAVMDGIKRLAGTRIDLEIWEGKGRYRKLTQEMTGAIVSWAGRDNNTGKLNVVINPYFIRMFGSGLLTNLDLGFRAGLKGDTSKALYRFFQGQRPLYTKGRYEIQLLKLCMAINLETKNIELFRLREQIRKGLIELRKQ